MEFKNKKIITENQHALIRLPSDGMKIIDLKTDGKISLGKFGNFEVKDIVGYCFGQSFEILNDGTVVPIKSMSEQVNIEQPEDEELDRDILTKIFSNSAENNQNIINIGSKIQKLTHEDINELKESGASSNIGQLIISKMIEGHEGFDKKTIHSQQKYLKRKQAKFLRRFTVEYLNSAQLMNYYMEKDLNRLLDMSQETLGLMLNYSNVRPGGKYLLVDETGGLILYAMLEKMGFEGEVLLVHENEHPNYSMLKHCDIPEDVLDKSVKFINWLQILEPSNERIDFEVLSDEQISGLRGGKRAQYFRRLKRANDINHVIDSIETGNFDGFISVTTLDATTFLPYVIPLVGGSRPICIYSQFKETLMEIQHGLMNDKRILAPSIYETRVTPFQTIPGRLHPVMTMRGFGGFVLTGTKVIPQENGIQAVGRGLSKRRREESPQVEKTEDSSDTKSEDIKSEDTKSEEDIEIDEN
ncbi:tRNA (adenine(58)-N(1))-methyltransferase non-catalytic subunit Trm6p [[Candida] jaroonii]|uniref:tRNA (Adenine(58)-N(1))-methyltransferase non-catalytic subunit Trm6p n=1 Tax=[Candida] jaroonii TaxID=467808 RepID=A0ACA9Y634_9ASCO|nr:tRNA (adenine(58)-N(1))-methyltransferase non-catalytic subunit Trm6p [[Candida] jaroonii]